MCRSSVVAGRRNSFFDQACIVFTIQFQFGNPRLTSHSQTAPIPCSTRQRSPYVHLCTHFSALGARLPNGLDFSHFHISTTGSVRQSQDK